MTRPSQPTDPATDPAVSPQAPQVGPGPQHTVDPAVGRGPPTAEVLKRRILVAQGQQPADLLLTGGRVVNVFTGTIESADVAVADGWIAGVGPYQWTAQEIVPLNGELILPGLIDAHMHVESTMLLPAELARLIVPLGTTTIVADPHEVANVMGPRGVELLCDQSQGLPLTILYMAPSCVPCTDWDDAGATLPPGAVADLLGKTPIGGLAELMDIDGVLTGRGDVVEKVLAAEGQGLPVDGHAPGLTGRTLMAYVAAGIRSDHESATCEEAEQKAALGMLVQIREGSSARNLQTLLPSLLGGRLGDWCLCTDDIEPGDLLRGGHILGLLQNVVQAGVPLVEAVRHCTLVPARHYGLRHQGAISPGYQADLVVLDQQNHSRASLVIAQGKVVARHGAYLATPKRVPWPEENTIRLGPLSEAQFHFTPGGPSLPVIQVIPDEILTVGQRHQVAKAGQRWQFDPQQDLVLAASLERHRGSGRIGLGLVTGLGLKRGAIGASVAHDAHNLIIAGTNSADMHLCAQELQQVGGGLIAVEDGCVLALLPLPVAGLLSTEPAESVCQGLQEVRAAAYRLGCPLPSPFGTLSFLALPVIPELRLTDQGLYDVRRGCFVTL